MFCWTCSPEDLSTDAVSFENLPADFPRRWLQWVDPFIQSLLVDFAHSSFSLLSEKLREILVPRLGDFFWHEVSPSLFIHCRLLKYPIASASKYYKNNIRANPHQDSSLLTLLAGSTADGLELLDGNSCWNPIHISHDAAHILVGTWLSDFNPVDFAAQTHRVVFGDQCHERYSLQAFLLVNPYALLRLKTITKFFPHFANAIMVRYKNAFLGYEPSSRWDGFVV
jgi:isopenicillin N synthase-like dioxygenase